MFGKSKFFIFWKARLLVVPVGFDPPLNVTQGRYSYDPTLNSVIQFIIRFININFLKFQHFNF